jgi:hypothetical protein
MKISLAKINLLLVLLLAACASAPEPSGASKWTIELVSLAPSPDGQCKIYDDANRLMLEGKLVDGKMDGIWTAWGSSGDRLAVLPYLSGVRNGRFQMWYGPLGDPAARGRLKLEGSFDHGSLQGAVTRYFPTGSRRSIRIYENGVLTSARYWSPEGVELSPSEAQKAAADELISDMQYVGALEGMVPQALAQARRKVSPNQ